MVKLYGLPSHQKLRRHIPGQKSDAKTPGSALPFEGFFVQISSRSYNAVKKIDAAAYSPSAINRAQVAHHPLSRRAHVILQHLLECRGDSVSWATLMRPHERLLVSCQE
jgi:hypothetical protein